VASGCGAAVLVEIFQYLGWEFILVRYPELVHSEAWRMASEWLQRWGLVAMLVIAGSPMPQTPALLFCALANVSTPGIMLAVGVGKTVKYLDIGSKFLAADGTVLGRYGARGGPDAMQYDSIPGLMRALERDPEKRYASAEEFADALEKVFGRYRANPQAVSGVYGAVVEEQEDWKTLKADIEAFIAEEGRRPRVMIAKLGQDGHDRGAKVVASAFADLGFDIDIGPLFQTPEEAARHAVENDVHAVGCSSLAAGHKTLVPAVIDELKRLGADDIITFVGGVIPAQDYDTLYAAGAKGIFGPGTPIPAAAREVLKQIRAARKAV